MNSLAETRNKSEASAPVTGNAPPQPGSDRYPVVVPGMDAVEQCCFQNGEYPDSYLVTEPDYLHFWDDQRTGCIGYVRDRKYLHVVGGLIAPPDRKEELLAQFTAFVDEHRYLASFFSISEQDLPLFRKYGYQATKFGEHTTLPLAGHSWQGKSYTWIRRQISYVSRQGLVFREIPLPTLTAPEREAVFRQLSEINREALSERVLKHEIGLLEGKLHPEAFFRRRLFVAHPADQPDRWEAFVACTPMRNGSGWATEMYRARLDSVRGVIPFLIARIVETCQAEGAEEVSLCMVPAINTQKYPDDSPFGRFMFGLWEKRLNFLFNSQGLYHFKSRFRPEFSPAFLCVRPKITLGSTFSFMMSVGVFKFDAWNWLKQKFSRTRTAVRSDNDTDA